jgi:hypothetical protein
MKRQATMDWKILTIHLIAKASWPEHIKNSYKLVRKRQPHSEEEIQKPPHKKRTSKKPINRWKSVKPV